MRAFWALISVLLLGGAAVLLLARPQQPGQPQRAAAPDSAPPPATPAARQESPTPAAPPSKPPIDFNADLKNAIGNALPSADTPSPAAGAAVDLPASAAWPAEKMTPAKAVRAGNALLLDGRYRVTGSGTQSDPYVVPFELLMSAADVFDPRKGLTKMPQRIAFLHDKWVRLNGYVAFPISSNDPRHMLVMFNQWDGCCIGVPPTTYDSIETNLAAPAKGDEKLAVFATTTGVLRVDPYVDNGWLLGLYVLDRAEMSEPKSDGAPARAQPDN